MGKYDHLTKEELREEIQYDTAVILKLIEMNNQWFLAGASQEDLEKILANIRIKSLGVLEKLAVHNASDPSCTRMLEICKK